MALNAANVRVAITGAVYAAPFGTVAPTTPTAVPSATYKDLGYINEDGITEATDVDTDEITTWQNGTVVRRTITSQSKTFEFALVETKKDVLEFIHPGSSAITGAGPYSMNVGAISAVRKSVIFDFVDGTITMRYVVPNCEITDFGDVEFVNGEAITYPITVTAYPDASNVIVYKMSDDASWS